MCMCKHAVADTEMAFSLAARYACLTISLRRLLTKLSRYCRAGQLLEFPAILHPGNTETVSCQLDAFQMNAVRFRRGHM